jgi:uncharacterized protein YutE (UPF0331/DUF86 family)
MSDKSPLFVSALELFAHATELYATGHPRKYKFVVLHLANSIELLLKDCMLDNGISIYKNPKETVTIWGCFDELDKLNIKIPERPVIELLIDDRNTIQHRFGFPDAESVYYYLEQVVAFFKRFLAAHYKLDLTETLKPHLSTAHLEMLGLVENEYSYLAKLMKISPQAAIIQAYKIIDEKIFGYISLYLSTINGNPKITYWRQPVFYQLLQDLESKEYMPKNSRLSYEELRRVRNYAAHVATGDENSIDWKVVFKSAENMIKGLQKAEHDHYQFVTVDNNDAPE